MSDKTKFYADQAKIRRSMDDQRARDTVRGDTRPRCQCGLTYHDTTIWAVQGARHDLVWFYCAVCAWPGLPEG